MKIEILQGTEKKKQELFQRPTGNNPQMFEIASQVLDEVRKEGDVAVKRYTHFFDQVDLENLEVEEEEWSAAAREISPELKGAIGIAYKNIETYHQQQISSGYSVTTQKGIRCWQENIPIDKVGIYIPGGSAPLFSTVLMLAIPAKLAGCENVVVCTPPNAEGKIDPTILFAARVCGVDRVFKVGGIQSIGAMAFGTNSIPKVDKIFGPGNSFVTIAKQLVQKYGVAIDLPAGPSELMMVADYSLPPEWAAADVLAQSEHGADSQVVLIATQKEYLEAVRIEVEKQLVDLPRKDIAEDALRNARFIQVSNGDEAMELVNEYGPEHLMLATSDKENLVKLVRNAGSVFLGKYSTESIGDYASGTNHTLPTSGYARAYSGVTVKSFQKTISFQQVTEEGLKGIGGVVETLAKAEQLEGHARSVSIRLGRQKKRVINTISEEVWK